MRAEIVAHARGWIDTPFRHQGRSARGIDCAGLVIVTARHIGLVAPDFDENNYPRRSPHSTAFRQYFDAHLVRKRAAPEPGDVIILKEPVFPCHCGIVGERNGKLTIIHAYAPRRKVVEEFLTHFEDRIAGVYAWPS